MQAIDRMISVRASLIMEQPFFGALAMRMDWVEDKSAKGLWTDGKNIGFNPQFALEAPFDELKARVCEIVMHNAHGHPWRRDARDSKKWNIACDRALWFDLQRSGFPLPKDVHYQASDDGAAAEMIYANIPDDPPPQQPQPSPQSGQGAGSDQEGEDEEQDEPGEGDGDSAEDPDDEQEDSEEPQSDPQQQEPEPDPDPGSMGEVRDYAGPDARAEEDEWKQAVLQAAQAAKMMGKLPGGLEKLLAQIQHPAVDWKSALRKFIDQAAKNDYSWRRPSKRYIPLGMYLPEIRSERLPPIMVTIDTSGSIDQRQLDIFASELTQVMAECMPERVYVLYVDSMVQRVDEFEAGDVLTFKAKGGGGTNMPVSWKWAEDHGVEPACALVFTDMETPFGDEPDFPTLWCTTSRNVAPYGETLRIEINEI